MRRIEVDDVWLREVSQNNCQIYKCKKQGDMWSGWLREFALELPLGCPDAMDGFQRFIRTCIGCIVIFSISQLILLCQLLKPNKSTKDGHNVFRNIGPMGVWDKNIETAYDSLG